MCSIVWTLFFSYKMHVCGLEWISINLCLFILCWKSFSRNLIFENPSILNYSKNGLPIISTKERKKKQFTKHLAGELIYDLKLFITVEMIKNCNFVRKMPILMRMVLNGSWNHLWSILIVVDSFTFLSYKLHCGLNFRRCSSIS